MANPIMNHPGQYFDESQKQVMAQQPTSLSTAGFVGTALMGPINKATAVTSWNDFTSKFGSFMANSYLAYAVYGFFLNGGSLAYIVRVVHNNTATGLTSAPATLNIGTGALILNASSDGTWGNALTAEIQAASWGSAYYKLVIRYQNVVVEVMDNLDPASATQTINNTSQYVVVETATSTAPAVAAPANFAGGNDGLVGIVDADYIGSSATAPTNKPTGLYSFNSVVGGINLVAIPGITTAVVQQGIQTYVNNHTPANIFAILDSPIGMAVTDIINWRQVTCVFDTINASLFYPNVVVKDPIGIGPNPLITIPPSGHIAGAFARNDNARGAWKAAAGLETALVGVVNTEYLVTEDDQNLLNPVGIDCLMTPYPNAGIVIWGDRTLTKSDSRYIHSAVRRLIQYIESTLKNNTGWAVFEPINKVLYNRLLTAATGVVNSIWLQGGLAGDTASQAYIVVCDESNNNGKAPVVADIGVAAEEPGEFIMFRVNLIG